MDFSYTIFSVKKNKCGKNFKIRRKSLFQGVTPTHLCKLWKLRSSESSDLDLHAGERGEVILQNPPNLVPVAPACQAQHNAAPPAGPQIPAG
jgi:hypothetical protein